MSGLRNYVDRAGAQRRRNQRKEATMLKPSKVQIVNTTGGPDDTRVYIDGKELTNVQTIVIDPLYPGEIVRATLTILCPEIDVMVSGDHLDMIVRKMKTNQ